jgi:hypothetical protein
MARSPVWAQFEVMANDLIVICRVARLVAGSDGSRFLRVVISSLWHFDASLRKRTLRHNLGAAQTRHTTVHLLGQVDLSHAIAGASV